MAEGVGFEPTVALRLLLISSQVPLTTQPPFRTRFLQTNLPSYGSSGNGFGKVKSAKPTYRIQFPAHRLRRVRVHRWVD